MRSPSDGAWAPEPGEILSVSDLLARVRGSLEDQFSWVWVEGEISNLRIPSSGHAYFSLLDRGAQLRAVCFRSTLRLVPLPLSDGLRVLARGRVTLYEARGDVQLVVEDLEAEGEGLQRLELEALKRRLSEEGLFAAERKRALPELPGAVGVVTSATGAALQDILQVMGRRAPGVNVFLAASRVQGEGAAAELCAALQMVGEHPAVEVVILGRGGGGAEDLGAFNDEGLVRAVAACPKPVVSAVGHEIDLTLCDLAADLRAPTPSAAAELAVGEWRAWGDRVARSGRSLVAAYSHRLTRLRNLLERHDPGFRSQRPRLQRLSVAVDRAQEALTANALRRCHRARTGLSRLETRLARGAPEQRLRERRAHLLHLDQRLHGAAGRAVAAGRHQLQRRRGELGALSPLAVLERGYAVVRNTAGAVVRDAATVLPGSRVEVRLAMGELGCTVDTVRTGEAAGDE